LPKIPQLTWVNFVLNGYKEKFSTCQDIYEVCQTLQKLKHSGFPKKLEINDLM
jgi:hypothetical protein